VQPIPSKFEGQFSLYKSLFSFWAFIYVMQFDYSVFAHN